MNGKKEFGDYQTPPAFAEEVCRFLQEEKRVNPGTILEPTCGLGSFIKGSLSFHASRIYGVEINPEYCRECRSSIADERVEIINGSIFDCELPVPGDRETLVIGNPPWVTSSALSAMGSANLPEKSNFKGLSGIDAMTGNSNFDICEFIIESLLYRFSQHGATLAMLCKTTVARNVFQEMRRAGIGCEEFSLYEFDSAAVFSVSVPACLLFIKQSPQAAPPESCTVYDFRHPGVAKSSFGYVNGEFYSDLRTAADDFNGTSCFEWRQGVKHDCAKIMELTKTPGAYRNGQKEQVELEDSLVFPLVKSSMFKAPLISSFSKYVIVTQKKPGEPTEHIRETSPKVWNYLCENAAQFNKRKSSIYANAPQFAMFGVGDYSFSRYKVGVSGFYKKPLFALLCSEDKKPVMTDDTGYFISFDSYDMAYVAMLYLNSERVQSFLTSIAFLDSKRPYTKKVLSRLDFGKIVRRITPDEIRRTERSLSLPPHLTQGMVARFTDTVRQRDMQLL